MNRSMDPIFYFSNTSFNLQQLKLRLVYLQQLLGKPL